MLSSFCVFYHYRIIYDYSKPSQRVRYVCLCDHPTRSPFKSLYIETSFAGTLNGNLSFFSRGEVFSRTNHCCWLPSGSIEQAKNGIQSKEPPKFFNKSNYMLCSLCILPSSFSGVYTAIRTGWAVELEPEQSRAVFSFRLVFLGDKIFLIYEKNSVYFLQQSCPLFVAFASRPGHRQKSVNT